MGSCSACSNPPLCLYKVARLYTYIRFSQRIKVQRYLPHCPPSTPFWLGFLFSAQTTTKLPPGPSSHPDNWSNYQGIKAHDGVLENTQGDHDDHACDNRIKMYRKNI